MKEGQVDVEELRRRYAEFIIANLREAIKKTADSWMRTGQGLSRRQALGLAIDEIRLILHPDQKKRPGGVPCILFD